MIYDMAQLNYQHRSFNTFSLLESFQRIERDFVKPTPATIPLLENPRFGAYIAKYSDLLTLSEEYNISVQESMNSILKAHNLRADEVIVSLEEWRPYCDPLILHRFTNDYVLIPEIDTPAYRLCEVCMEAFFESGDSTWIDIFINTPELTFLNEAYTKEHVRQMTDAVRKQHPTWSNEQISQQVHALLGWADKNREVFTKVDQERKDAENKAEGWKLYTSMEEERKKQEKAKEQKEETTKQEQPSQDANKEQEQSWLSKKWTAFKNWWNNAGQKDENGNVGWFSNLIGKIKRGLGIGNSAAVQNATTNSSTTTANATNDTAAKPAQPVDQKQQSDTSTQSSTTTTSATTTPAQNNQQTTTTTAPATPPPTTTSSNPASNTEASKHPTTTPPATQQPAKK